LKCTQSDKPLRTALMHAERSGYYWGNVPRVDIDQSLSLQPLVCLTFVYYQCLIQFKYYCCLHRVHSSCASRNEHIS